MKTVVLLTIYLFSFAVGQTCTYTDSKGMNYNLAPLKNDQNDYFQNVVAKKWNIWINVCRPLVTTLCGTAAAGCQQWDPSTPAGKASLGTVASMALTDLKRPGPGPNGKYGVTASFTNGGSGRTFEVDFQCDEGQNPGSFGFLDESPNLHYNFGWPTKYACPSNMPPPPPPGPPPANGKKLSGGSILLILLLVVAVVYITAGLLWNKFKAQKNGVELVPNLDFWTSLPGLVKDGIMFPINKIRGRSGYSQV